MNTQLSTNTNPEVPSREQLFQSCQHLATSPNILDVFISELNRGGFAGEERASRLIFLSLITRLFEDPVSVAVKGPSSAGKSHTVQQVLRFFPSESYYAMSAMSEKALAYCKEPLKHRFLVIYEAEGMAGEMASYFIRSLLSEGCVDYKTLVQSVDGWHPKRLYIEGPTGLLTTTTRVALHPENETRLLSIPVNDSPEQTKRIMKAMVSQAGKSEIDYAPWHDLQLWLGQGPTAVVIPFGESLAENTYAGAVRLRRDFPKLLSLIRAHAVLHQQSRERDEHGSIIASTEDYSAVREMTSDLLAEAAEHGVSEVIRETVAAVRDLAHQHVGGVSVTALAEKLNIDKSSATRRTHAAIEKGYLGNLETRKGVPAKLILGDPLPEEQEVLPPVEKVAA